MNIGVFEHSPAFEKIAAQLRLRILQSGFGSMDSRWTTPEVTIPASSLIFLTAGEACYQFAQHNVQLRPGRAYLMPKHARVAKVCTAEFTALYFNFCLEIYPTRDLFDGLGHCLEMSFPPVEVDDLLVLFRRGTLSATARLEARLLTLLAGLIDGCAVDLMVNAAHGEKFRGVFNVIGARAGFSLTPQLVARELSVAERSLTAAFRRYMGVTLREYILREVISRAMERLAATSDKVRDIATDLAFADEYYFSRFFKKRTGLSPLEYRRSFSGGR